MKAESMLPNAKFSQIKPDVMRFLVCVVLLLHALSVFAQNEHYNFYKLDNYTGLSHNQVNAIVKDQDGFLWFGTMSGLNRYD
ncbi:MAG: two-component regulator propeller domain-containing protein, partial [Chitinophagaceae bacterium]